jgi:hypothetical protein
MKGFCAVLLSAILTTAAIGSPVAAARRSPKSATGPASGSDASDLRLPDPSKELRQLSKDLKLKKDQRVGVGFILQERSREIQLLMDIESLSEQYRETLAARVMEDSDAQIETLLRSKQKRKFDKVLAKDHDAF